jgi:hypothetical protein
MKEKYITFAEYYHQTGNRTQAAIVAGYSERSARLQGYKLSKRPEIIAYLKELKSFDLKDDNTNLITAKSVRLFLTKKLEAFDKTLRGKTITRQDLSTIGGISKILIQSFEVTDFEERIAELEKLSQEAENNNKNKELFNDK